MGFDREMYSKIDLGKSKFMIGEKKKKTKKVEKTDRETAACRNYHIFTKTFH